MSKFKSRNDREILRLLGLRLFHDFGAWTQTVNWIGKDTVKTRCKEYIYERLDNTCYPGEK